MFYKSLSVLDQGEASNGPDDHRPHPVHATREDGCCYADRCRSRRCHCHVRGDQARQHGPFGEHQDAHDRPGLRHPDGVGLPLLRAGEVPQVLRPSARLVGRIGELLRARRDAPELEEARKRRFGSRTGKDCPCQ